MNVYFSSLLISACFCLFVCDEINIKSKIINLPNFDEAFAFLEILFSVNVRSLLDCVAGCLSNPYCDTSVICDTSSNLKYCLQTKGNIYESNSHLSSLINCRAIPKVPCANNGRYYDGMCQCVPGFTGEVCELIVPDCCKETTMKSSIDPDATLNDLIAYFSEAGEIKFMINEGDHDIVYQANFRYYPSSKSYVEIQSFDHIVINLQNRQNTTMIRIIKEIRTDTKVSTWLMNMDMQNIEQESLSQATFVDWVTTRYTGRTPCLKRKADGTIMVGSPYDCRVAVENGSAVHINKGALRREQITYLSQTKLNVNFAAQIDRSNAGRIKVPSYWFDRELSTDTICPHFKWEVKKHILYSKVNKTSHGTWFVDEGWHEAYSHTPSGTVLRGSLSYLKAAVLNGRRIRVKFNNIVSELRNIYIYNEEIHGAMFDIYNETEKAKYLAQLIRAYVSSSGNVISCTFLWESDLNHGWWSSISSSYWYVESRRWVKTIYFNAAKEVIYGSVFDLFNVARKGKSVRVVINYKDDSYQAFEIINIHLFNTSYVVLDTAKQDAVVYNGVDWVCQHWAGFLATDGVYETVKWTTGRQVIQTRVAIDYISIVAYSEL